MHLMENYKISLKRVSFLIIIIIFVIVSFFWIWFVFFNKDRAFFMLNRINHTSNIKVSIQILHSDKKEYFLTKMETDKFLKILKMSKINNFFAFSIKDYKHCSPFCIVLKGKRLKYKLLYYRDCDFFINNPCNLSAIENKELYQFIQKLFLKHFKECINLLNN